ncbi:hypothetical protein Leryth_013360 [Lithospermum erythrorhizon]|nr:hypothetical protein Leryth_013360 [Lithospermum erythrorhizon]
MEDWGAVLVATLLFVLLTPGLIFQLPVGLSSLAISRRAPSPYVIFFGLVTIFLIAVGVHITTG